MAPGRRDREDLVSTSRGWSAACVLHDAVLAPLVLALGWPARACCRPAWRAAVAGGLVVLGTVTLMAVPVLGRFGAKPDNPTLLDRPYVAGWLVLAGLVVAGVGVVGLLRSRAGRPRS